MTIKRAIYLAVSLTLTAGIALAQQPSPPASTPAPDESFGAFQLLVDGNGFLGVHAEDINQENLGRYGLRDARGVGITEIVKDSPAEKAGLRKGDVILRFDGESVTSVRKLTRLVSEVAPDQSVSFRISRGGSEQDLSVTIGKRKNLANTFEGLQDLQGLKGLMNGDSKVWKLEVPRGGNDWPFVYSFGNNRRIGVSTTTLTKQLADFFGVADGKGVLVTSVEADSPAAKAGIRAGDVITAIDGEKVEGAGDLSRGINKQKDGEVSLTIVRDKSSRTIKLTPTKAETPMGRVTAENRRAIRDAIRGSVLRDTRTIVIPRIELPTIPEINIATPRIELPTIPEINVVMPRTPKIRVIRAPRQPI